MKRKSTKTRVARSSRKSGKTTRAPWTSKDLAELKRRNKAGEHARDIAKALHRSVGAVRQYAYSKGVRLRAKRV